MRLLKWPQKQCHSLWVSPEAQKQISTWGKSHVSPARLFHYNVLSPPKFTSDKQWIQVFCEVTAGQDRGTCGILPHPRSAAGLTHCTVLCSRFDCHFKFPEDPRPLTSRRRQSSSMKICFAHYQALSNSPKPDLCLRRSPRKASLN